VNRPNGLALAPSLSAFGMAGRWKSWLLQKKAGFLASFEMFSALRAGLAGEVRAESDFKARAAVFFTAISHFHYFREKIYLSEFYAQIKRALIV
jgi:hypothetical protein